MDKKQDQITLEDHDHHLLITAQRLTSMDQKINELTRQVGQLVSIMESLSYQISLISEEV